MSIKKYAISIVLASLCSSILAENYEINFDRPVPKYQEIPNTYGDNTDANISYRVEADNMVWGLRYAGEAGGSLATAGDLEGAAYIGRADGYGEIKIEANSPGNRVTISSFNLAAYTSNYGHTGFWTLTDLTGNILASGSSTTIPEDGHLNVVANATSSDGGVILKWWACLNTGHCHDTQSSHVYIDNISYTIETTYDHWVNDDDPSGGGYVGQGTSCDNPGYSTIQAAVDASSSGERIGVCSGVYNEDVYVNGGNKSGLFISSTQGAHSTVINGQGTSGYAVRINNASGVTFEGFKVQPYNDGYDGIQTLGNNTTISNNVIPFSRAGMMTGCLSNNNVIKYNTVNAKYLGGGINLDTCEGTNYGSDNK